jgi:plastocyanin
MRNLSARFVLGTLVVGSLCLLVTPAEAGPFRKRYSNNNDACCPQTVGYGYGYGGYGYATPYGGGYSYAPVQGYPTIQPTGGYLPTTGYPMIEQTGAYAVGSGAVYPAVGSGTTMYAPTAGYGTPCCGASGYTYAQPIQYPSVGYAAPMYTSGYGYNPCCGSGYSIRNPSYYGPGAYTMPGAHAYPGFVQPGTYIPPTGVPGTGGTDIPGKLPDLATEATKARITDGTFEPKTLTITPGTTVRWTNDGKKPHTVTSDKGDWGSNEIPPGGEFTATFTKVGTFEYHCKLHEGMKGTIVVK